MLRKQACCLFRCFVGLLFFTFSYTAFAANLIVIKPYSQFQFDHVINKLYQTNPDSHSQDLSKRFLADSGLFLGKPYVLGALGEGPTAKFDQEPLYRTDAFDCMTYVSTVLALVESNNLKQFKKNILAIRYANAKPSFLTRNHFASIDWNANNQKKGFLRPITAALYPKTSKIAVAVINKPAWYQHLTVDTLRQLQKPSAKKIKKLLSELHGFSKQTKPKLSRLPYEPLSAFFTSDGKAISTRFAKIPNDSIIEIVRPNWQLKSLIGTNLNVSHLGFAVWINGVLYFREASSLQHKVIDVPLEHYLANYLHSPTIKGIAIFAIDFKK